jgi:membrane protein DedA with SNARE-associated domain
MFEFLNVIEKWLLSLSETVSVELFVMVGGFLEELIAPIPSPLVLGTAGTLVEVAGNGWVYMVWIAVVASVAKLMASLILYVLVDKFEDVFMEKFGKFMGVTHEDVEGLGERLGESPWVNFFVLFGLRALPAMSSAVVSVMAGFVKIDLKIYVLATFLGNIIRNLFFIGVGYYGLESASGLMNGMDSLGSVMKLLALVLVVAVFLYFKFRKKK